MTRIETLKQRIELYTAMLARTCFPRRSIQEVETLTFLLRKAEDELATIA